MIENTAGQRIWVRAFNAEGFVEGDADNISAEVTIDGAAPVALAGPPTETSAGWYYFSPTKAQTDGHEIQVNSISSTLGVQVQSAPGVIYTIGLDDSESGSIFI